MIIRRGTEEDRQKIAPARSEQWGGGLSVSQCTEKHRRLYGHPFGKNRIETYVGVEGNTVLTALDIVRVSMQSFHDGTFNDKPTFLVVSFIVPKEYRGRGYGTQLFEWVVEREPGMGILYSDISPDFYTKYGYELFPMYACELPAGAGPSETWRGLSVGGFVEVLNAQREASIRGHEGGCTLRMDFDWLDWILERYRFAAGVAGTTLDGLALLRQLGHEDHVVGMAPNYQLGRLDVLWYVHGCGPCEAQLRRFATEYGLNRICLWCDTPRGQTPHVERPMIRRERGAVGMVAAQAPSWRGIQFCDWW